MLDTEYRFFVDNKDILFRDYPNKFVIIIGTDIVASFDTFEEAYFNAIKTYPEGTFLIDQCTGEIKPQVFHSRVRF